jgi:hypothetical protein
MLSLLQQTPALFEAPKATRQANPAAQVAIDELSLNMRPPSIAVGG